MRYVTCKNNENNFELDFREDDFSPFILASIEGIYFAKNKVTISENAMTDGSTYQGSVAETRNIVLKILENPNPNKEFVYNQEHRDILYVLFQKGSKGTFTYWENDTAREIDYYCESITRELTGTRPFIISLLCPNPFFKDIDDTIVSMADWISQFEFIHEFVAEGEELAYRSEERLINIINDKAAKNIGLTISIKAIGSASNITITRIENNKHISIGSANKPFNMLLDDEIIITTNTNDKHVRLKRNGVITKINQYLTEDSEFFQLLYGDNNIVYSAETGEENLIVTIKYNFQYEGA